MTRRSRGRIYLARAGKIAAGFAAFVVLLIAFGLFTNTGRSWILETALEQINAQIPGTLSAQRLVEIQPWAVELGGVEARDPTGEKVLEVRRVRLELNARALLSGRFVGHRLVLAGGSVDLRKVDASREGLLSAFVDPDAPEEVSAAEAPTPYVRVSVIELDAIEVLLPPTPLGELVAKVGRARGSFELDGEPSARLDEFALEVVREDTILAELDVAALMAPGKSPSRIELTLLAGEARVVSTASAVLPWQEGWRAEPAALDLRVEGLRAEGLARVLRDDAMADAFVGPITARVSASGTPDDLDVTFDFETPGGPVKMQVRLQDLEHATWRAHAEDLALARVHRAAPKYVVGATVTGEARFADLTSIGVVARLDDATIDGTPLPLVEIEGTLGENGIDALLVRARDARSRLDLSGDVTFDGSGRVKLDAKLDAALLRKIQKITGAEVPKGRGRLDARLEIETRRFERIEVDGQLSARAVAVGDVSVDAIDATVHVEGDWPRLMGAVRAEARGLNVGETRLRRGTVRIAGGPQSYDVLVRADSNRGRGRLAAKVAVSDEFVVVRATGSGSAAGAPVSLVLEPTRIDRRGRVVTEGVKVRVAEQEVFAEGRLAPDALSFEFRSERVDLLKISRLLELEPPVRGVLTLDGRLRGSGARPIASLSFRGRDIGLGKRPGVDAEGQVDLDAQVGELRVRLDATSPKAIDGKSALDVGVIASSDFTPGPNLTQSLAESPFTIDLVLTRLHSDFLREWIGVESLPVSGAVAGKAKLQGPLSSPSLKLSSTSELLAFGRSELVLDVGGEYTRGKLETSASLRDELGGWVTMTASGSFADAPTDLDFDALLARLPTAADQAKWSVDVAAAEREVAKLPLPADLGSMPPARVAVSANVTHEPSAEPEGALRIALRQSGAYGPLGDCRSEGFKIDARAKLRGGKLHATLAGRGPKQELLSGKADAVAKLAPWLRGEAPELRALDAELETRVLRLSSLPFLCQQLRGTLTAKLAGTDLLGGSRRAEGKIRAASLSFGSSERVDVELDLSATNTVAKVDGSVVSRDRTSRIHARLPIQVKEGEPIVPPRTRVFADVELDRLHIAPFLDPKGSISYASGSVSGALRLRGTVAEPKPSGHVDLNDVAFTATEFAQPVRRVAGRIRLQDQKVHLENISAKDRDGTLRLDGEVGLSDLPNVEAKLDLSARDFPVRQQGQVVATLKLDAAVRARSTPTETVVHLDLTNVDTWLEGGDLRRGLSLKDHPDIVVDGESALPGARAKNEPAKAKAAGQNKESPESAAPTTTRLVVDASESFWVKRSDFAVKLRTKLVAEIDRDAARVTGKVDLERGYLQLMGKVFDIDRSSELRFIGSDTPDPVLDIVAKHDNRRTGDDVTVRISGRGSKPELEFLVNSQSTTAGEAFLAIYGSQQSNERPEEAEGQAQQFVGGLTAGLLATTARRELGAAAPILMVEPGEKAGAGRVRAGFELDSLIPPFLRRAITGLYVEGIVANEEQQDANVQGGALLELYFPRSIFTTGQYGPGSTWSVDVGIQVW